jgi:Predicted transcriptional regulators
MNFNTEKPIYLQIVDVIADRILSGELKGGDRIPSVREYGADIGVNPNTMMRSYEKLTADGIIYNKRGIGYFVADDAGRPYWPLSARISSRRKSPPSSSACSFSNLIHPSSTDIIQ